MTRPKRFAFDVGTLNYKVYQAVPFKVKVPDAAGEYIMSYWIKCDEYTGDEITFKIKVI